jgi:hypothetical protein
MKRRRQNERTFFLFPPFFEKICRRRNSEEFVLKMISEIDEGQILVRVYGGGQESPQLGPFMSVGHLFGHLLGRKVKLEYLFVSDIREKNWSPFDLVEWLKESNFHFILTHPHQGNPRWDCSDVYTALEDLEDHSGFPHKQSFHCPIFSQHKFRYLTAVSEIVNPTLAIPFPKVRRQFDKLGKIR